MPVLAINKAIMHKFLYDYIKPKYEDKTNLCYMDTDSFIAIIKTENAYKDIAKWMVIEKIIKQKMCNKTNTLV